ncbi:stigma-specific STIG1-like protein 1 [Aristolochia californica]|uniref:stigma-specific STIG1-like protein 1 n=1 Tax=Aristolochia californica TaxID=171875 RepID=UPI0035DBD0B8
MKLGKLFFITAMALLLVIARATTPTTSEEDDDEELPGVDNHTASNDFPSADNEPLSLRGVSRLLAQKNPKSLKCNKNPRICRAKGSPGPDCCKKKCINVTTDRLNCGLCGRKCKYREVCCKGQCVNMLMDRRNCGRCNNKCKKGGVCVYGLCNYA